MHLSTIDLTQLTLQLVQARITAQRVRELRQLRVEKCQLLMTLQALGRPITKSQALAW